MKSNLIVLLSLFALISCRENKNTSNGKPQTTEAQQNDPRASENSSSNPAIPVDDTSSGEKVIRQQGESLMPFIISFYSIGQGIDRGQKEKLMAYLESHEKRTGKKMEYSEVHWGREGETDFCFPMIGFSDSEVTDFIKGAKQALNTAEHVHFLQNQACRKGR